MYFALAEIQRSKLSASTTQAKHGFPDLCLLSLMRLAPGCWTPWEKKSDSSMTIASRTADAAPSAIWIFQVSLKYSWFPKPKSHPEPPAARKSCSFQPPRLNGTERHSRFWMDQTVERIGAQHPAGPLWLCPSWSSWAPTPPSPASRLLFPAPTSVTMILPLPIFFSQTGSNSDLARIHFLLQCRWITSLRFWPPSWGGCLGPPAAEDTPPVRPASTSHSTYLKLAPLCSQHLLASRSLILPPSWPSRLKTSHVSFLFSSPHSVSKFHCWEAFYKLLLLCFLLALAAACHCWSTFASGDNVQPWLSPDLEASLNLTIAWASRIGNQQNGILSFCLPIPWVCLYVLTYSWISGHK